jgi:CDP-paratose 2-epimerase
MSFDGRRVLITGGAGFIGTNVTTRVLAEGGEAVVLDDLSRAGVKANVRTLRSLGAGRRLRVVVADVRDRGALRRALDGVDTVFHFAAQVAVTTSVDEPRHDFEVNLGGTFAVLDEVRACATPPALLFTSTNKVYGDMLDLVTVRDGDRYVPADPQLREHGISEARPLSFCSPYGCSKGGADQYVLDFAKSYGIPSVVFRMSCIYGPHQCGNEDQGWVAHFLLCALAGRPITLYGDGRQVRDILHVADAVAAYRAVLAAIEDVKGRAFNLGGGPRNAVSLRTLLAEIAAVLGRETPLAHGDWRRGDQLFFVADTRRIEAALGWKPRIGWREGVRDLAGWLARNRLGAPLAEPRRIVA